MTPLSDILNAKPNIVCYICLLKCFDVQCKSTGDCPKKNRIAIVVTYKRKLLLLSHHITKRPDLGP